MKSYMDIEYKQGLTLEIHIPECDNFSTFIYFHGGGLEHGGTKCSPFAETLCKKGVAVVSVQYRMYPNAKYPEYLEDCAEAIAWVFKNIGKYGKCDKIYAGGSSAGGYISMMLQFDNKYLQNVGLDPLDLAGYIHDAGQPTAHFNVLKKDRGIDPRRIIVDETAPLYHIGVAEKYSPMLIIVSDNDMQNRYEQTQLVISTLKHFGHVDNVYYKEMQGKHCAYVYQADDDGEGILGNLVWDFVKSVEGRAE